MLRSLWIPVLMSASLADELPPLRLPAEPDAVRAAVTATAERLAVPAEVVNSLGMTLRLIPPGDFAAGPNGSTHHIQLKKPFYIGTTEVTLGQYRKYKEGHALAGCAAEFNDDDRPAAGVSWEEARAFCAWLSQREEEQAAGRIYALPTEAQWEWAARGGTTGVRYFADEKQLPDFAWFNKTYTPNPRHESDGRGRQPVGRLPANAFGLHDMLGNVWEWCADRRIDADTGETRDPVMRGGSWRSGGFHCTAVAHDPGAPQTRADNIGFRVVLRLR